MQKRVRRTRNETSWTKSQTDQQKTGSVVEEEEEKDGPRAEKKETARDKKMGGFFQKENGPLKARPQPDKKNVLVGEIGKKGVPRKG